MKMFSIFILTVCVPGILFATQDSTTSGFIPKSSPYNRYPVHLIAMINTPSAFTATRSGSSGTYTDRLIGFAITSYMSGGPSVPGFYISSLQSGTSPFSNRITVPYTGQYRIGGMIILYQTGRNISAGAPGAGAPAPSIDLSLQGGSSGQYPASGSTTIAVGTTAGTEVVIDLGQYFAASNTTLTQGNQLFLWTWTGGTSDTGLIYILPGSYVTLDSVDF